MNIFLRVLFFTTTSFCLYTIMCEQTSENTKNFEFDIADLSIDYETEKGNSVHLEGFGWSGNRLIIQNREKDRFSQLTWLSLGLPSIIPSTDENLNNNLFKFNSEGFNFQISMLTEEHKNKLADVAQRKYNITVLPDQIVRLEPSSFKCSTKFYENNTHIVIYGEAKDWHSYPILVDFDAPNMSIQRILLEEKLRNTKGNLDLAFDCDFVLEGKSPMTNTLYLSANQFNKWGLIEKIFGASNAVYITRKQLANLATELYSRLNIVEDYEMTESTFSENFIPDLINQAADRIIDEVKFDEAINKLSRYTYETDFDPDAIKTSLGSLWKIESTVSDENQTSLNEDQYIILKNASDTEKSDNMKVSDDLLGIGGDSIDRLKNDYKKIWDDLAQQNKSLDEKLSELNNHTQDYVIWELEDEKIIPKSFKLIRLIKAHFTRNLLFNRIKRVYYGALYKRTLRLYITKIRTNRIDHVQIFTAADSFLKESTLFKKKLDELETKNLDWEKNASSSLKDFESKFALRNEIRIQNKILANLDAQLPKIGDIKYQTSSQLREGWMPCDGRSLDSKQYHQLFLLIGFTFGGSDMFFNIPDLRGRTVIGAGIGKDLSRRSVGEIGGEEKHQLLVSEMPSHTHNLILETYPGENSYGTKEVLERAEMGHRVSSMHVHFEGGDEPHNIMQPFIVLNAYIYTGVN